MSAASDGISNAEILIGMEGPAHSFSADEENHGMRLAMRQANEAGGVHLRMLVERSYPRGNSSPVEQAFANARRLVEQDQVFLLFNIGGAASLQIAPYASAQRVPYLFPHTALLTVNGERYNFTSYPRYAGEARVMFRYLAQTRGLRRIAIIHDHNIYGRFFLDRLREHADAFGYEFAGNLELASRTPGDLSAELGTLREHRPDALVLALYPEQANAVMNARAALDWRSVTAVSAGPLTDEQYLNVPGGYAEGTLGFCYYPDPEVSAEPGVIEYREAMQRYFPGHACNRYSLYGYVFGRLIVEGLQRAGPEIDRERFVDAMESIRGWDSGGILPPVSFSRTNHHAQSAGFIAELRNGRFADLTGWIEAS